MTLTSTKTNSRYIATLAIASSFGFCSSILGNLAFAEESYEEPSDVKARDVLPAEMITGPNHTVRDQVLSDGFMLHYQLDSPYGQLNPKSTAELRIHIEELNVIELIEKARASDEFAVSAKDSAADVAEGARNLVTDPIGSLSGAASGVGAIFRRSRDSLVGDPANESEDARYKAVIGFSTVKREYAAELGVDVYSTNPLLQQHLDDLAWAGYRGSLTTNVLLAAIPGGLGLAISATKGTHVMNEALRTLPPTDLRRMNREKLAEMGVPASTVDIFMQNNVFTPTNQTLLVAALEEMDGVSDRGVFVELLFNTGEHEQALFRQRQAQMYAGYHEKVKPIDRFVSVGNLAAAQRADGTLVIVVPIDRLAWSRTAAAYVFGIEQSSDKSIHNAAKELWTGGTLTPLARESMTRSGWAVHENVEDRLFGQ